jgi:hypothetical protein
MIDPQIVAAVAHELHPASSSSVLTGGRAPTACIADDGEHIWQLEFHMHRHGAAIGSIGVLYGIGTGFADSDE